MEETRTDTASADAARLEIHVASSEQQRQDGAAIRTIVFVEEQGCPPDLEWDEHEEVSRHLVGYLDGTPVAAARWRTVTYEGRLSAKLERFAVLDAYRGRGLGRRMVGFALDDARSAGFAQFILHAQLHLESFYESFGFERFGEPFVEAGIEHIKMSKQDPA